jgi:uncharacterized membrane protein
VTVNDRRSHWVARGPAGTTIEWDAEITHEVPNERIAWKTLPESTVQHSGEVSFAKAMGDRGIEVCVKMDYLPPAGRLGHLFAKVTGESPERQIRDELRNFKRLMETGEIPTVEGQPRGTCSLVRLKNQ